MRSGDTFAKLCSVIFLSVATMHDVFATDPTSSISTPSAGSQQSRAARGAIGSKPIVAIYEFRSGVPEIPAKAAQDMFVTALVRSGAFSVAERHRLNEGIMRERELNSAGWTTGNVSANKLAGVNYIFEVIVSEANVAESSDQIGVNVAGMQVGKAAARDSIGLDVRIVDPSSGIVVDAVNVRKSIEASTTTVSGAGQALSNILGLRGRTLPVEVDAGAQTSRKDSVDRALRSCIELAVAQLAKRLREY